MIIEILTIVMGPYLLVILYFHFKYPEMNWQSDIPTAKGLTIGKSTRFKKGQSARKVISHPIELDPKR